MAHDCFALRAKVTLFPSIIYFSCNIDFIMIKIHSVFGYFEYFSNLFNPKFFLVCKFLIFVDGCTGPKILHGTSVLEKN